MSQAKPVIPIRMDRWERGLPACSFCLCFCFCTREAAAFKHLCLPALRYTRPPPAPLTAGPVLSRKANPAWHRCQTRHTTLSFILAHTFPEFPSPQIVLLPNVSPRLEVNATSPRRWSPIVPMEVFPPMTSTKPRRQDKSTDHGRRLDDAKQPSYQTIKQAFAKVWPESHNACFFSSPLSHLGEIPRLHPPHLSRFSLPVRDIQT